MKESKRRIVTVISIVMIAFAVILIAGIIVVLGKPKEKNHEFTSEKWKACEDEKRHQYIESMEMQYELVGMERKKVEELLGVPSRTDRDDDNITAYEYRISDDILGGWKVYRISFENDLVTDAQTVSEDW